MAYELLSQSRKLNKREGGPNKRWGLGNLLKKKKAGGGGSSNGCQVYSVPGQTDGRRKAFLEGTGIDLSSKLSLTCEANVNYHKSVDHSILTLPVQIGNTLEIFKTNQ